jgi:hypothetical protein
MLCLQPFLAILRYLYAKAKKNDGRRPMFEGLVSQFDAMTLLEELHTICFTVFIVGGSICCGVRCLRPESPLNEAEPLPETALAATGKSPRAPRMLVTAAPPIAYPRRHYGTRLEAGTFRNASLMPPLRVSSVPRGAATAG